MLWTYVWITRGVSSPIAHVIEAEDVAPRVLQRAAHRVADDGGAEVARVVERRDTSLLLGVVSQTLINQSHPES